MQTGWSWIYLWNKQCFYYKHLKWLNEICFEHKHNYYSKNGFVFVYRMRHEVCEQILLRWFFVHSMSITLDSRKTVESNQWNFIVDGKNLESCRTCNVESFSHIAFLTIFVFWNEHESHRQLCLDFILTQTQFKPKMILLNNSNKQIQQQTVYSLS